MTEETAEKPKKLTPDEWAECRTLYELGQARTGELSERFGVTKQAISKHFKDHGVVFGSKKEEHDAKVAKAAAEAAAVASGAKVAAGVVTFESTRKAKIEETKNEAYNDLRLMAQATRKIVVDTMRGGLSLATVQGELKSLRLAAAIIEQTRQGRYGILQADKDIDEASLPVIRIENLSAQQMKDMRDKQTGESDLDISDDDDLTLGDEGDDEVVGLE